MSSQSPKQRQDRPGVLSRWIEDPFGSICAGLIAQVATFALLFAGMFGLSQIA
jgi:hypothetical protein